MRHDALPGWPEWTPAAVLVLLTGATLALVSDADRLAALLACVALAVVLGVRAR